MLPQMFDYPQQPSAGLPSRTASEEEGQGARRTTAHVHGEAGAQAPACPDSPADMDVARREWLRVATDMERQHLQVR